MRSSISTTHCLQVSAEGFIVSPQDICSSSYHIHSKYHSTSFKYLHTNHALRADRQRISHVRTILAHYVIYMRSSQSSTLLSYVLYTTPSDGDTIASSAMVSVLSHSCFNTPINGAWQLSRMAKEPTSSTTFWDLLL